MINTSQHRLWFFVLVVGTAYTVPHGYQIAVVNEPEHLMREWINQTTSYQFSNQRVVEIWSFVVSCRLIGSIIGNFLVPVLMEKFGRKNTLIFMSLFLIVGDMCSFCSYFANTFYLMIIGRLLTGMCTGGCLNVFTVYTSEIAPAHLRGRISIVGMIFRSAGMILAAVCGLSNLLGTASLWPYLFLIPAAVSLLGPPCLLLCPESPRWLYITKGDIDGALKSLRFYNGPNLDISKTVEELELASDQYSHRLQFRDVFRNPVFWKPLLLSILFGCVSAFGGRAVVMNYSTMLVSTAAIPVHYAKYVTLVAYILPLPVTFAMLPLVDRFGRKPLLTIVCSLTIFLEFTMFVAFMMLNYVSASVRVLSWVIVMAVLIWIPAVVGGLMSLQFIPSELFPQNARSVGYAVYIITTFGMGTVTAQGFQPLETITRGYGVVFLLVPMIISAFLLLWFLPETKNLTLESAAYGAQNPRSKDAENSSKPLITNCDFDESPHNSRTSLLRSISLTMVGELSRRHK